MTTGKRLNELYNELNKREIIKSKKEFAAFLKIDERNLGKYLNDTITADGVIIKAYEFFKRYNINLIWLLTGDGEMFLNKQSQLPGSIGADTLKEALPIITELVDLTAEQKQEILDFIKEIKK